MGANTAPPRKLRAEVHRTLITTPPAPRRGDSLVHTFCAGPSFRGSLAAQGIRIHRGRGAHVGGWRGRQHGDVQHAERGLDDTASLRRAAAPRDGQHDVRRQRQLDLVGAGLRGLSGSKTTPSRRFGLMAGFPMSVVATGGVEAQMADSLWVSWDLFRTLRVAPGPGARLSCRRGRPGGGRRGDPQPRVLASRLRGRVRCNRQRPLFWTERPRRSSV